jgi:MFS transporter, SP family, general alpha glucoside:H+ symporter
MYDAQNGNLGGKMGWIFFATSLIAGVLLWLELPETKDLTFAQIDERFEMRVSSRKFKEYRDELSDVSKMDEVELGNVEFVEDRKV